MEEYDGQLRRRHHRDNGSSFTAGRRRKTTKRTPSHKSQIHPSGEPTSADHPLTLDELRRVRLDYHTRSPQEKKSAMRYVYEPRSPQKAKSVRKVSESKTSRKSSRSEYGRRRKRRKAPETNDEGEGVYVYSQGKHGGSRTGPTPVVEIEEVDSTASTEKTEEPRKSRSRSGLRRSGTTRSSLRPLESDRGSIRSTRTSSKASKSRLQMPSRRYSSRTYIEPIEEDGEEAGLSRSKSARAPAVKQPSLRRSATSTRPRNDATRKPASLSRSKTEPVLKEGKKMSGSFFSSLFKPEPSGKVTCLTCLSDDIPASRAAKLACSHHMCYTCLKRIFRLSVSDPAHMPPKCCTSDHIPLKHVEGLFDMKFKLKWNRKYQEYMTRNRIYCPARNCGEWIKPSYIQIEHGRKVGKCKRCQTRVCCLCNNKMHKSRECPKDEATKQFIERAKAEGWQRCFNCKAMVELKEGCNHMTCICTAEFCMICGLKWKTCDCPWFNYNAVETDRLLHMNIPEARRAYANGEGLAPLRYQEEMERRREQERQDEVLARRMAMLGTDDDPAEDPFADIIGLGNAGGHHLNEHFIRNRVRDVLTGNFQQAQRQADALLNGHITGRENPLLPGPFEIPAIQTNPPLVNLRHQHTAATQAFNAAATTRPSERVIPGRRMSHYGAEAANHQPIPPDPQDPAAAGDDSLTAGTRPGLGRGASTRGVATPGTGSNGVSQLIGRADPSRRETAGRIHNWMNGVMPGLGEA